MLCEPLSSLEIAWPMAGLGALATGLWILAWVCSFEARALRDCGLSWSEILGLPDWSQLAASWARRRPRARPQGLALVRR